MAFDLFCSQSLNETTGLYLLDTGVPDINDPNTYYTPKGGAYSFYNPQFATLYMFKSMGTASYNAAQFSLRHRMTHGIQFDLNYTFSKSIDLASDAERVGTIGGNGAQIQNAWDPFQFRAVSDFDATHQFNANWVVDLPFGRNRLVGRNVSHGLDAVIGGWQLSGLFRLTSGFPFSVGNGYQWPTDWDLSGNGYLTGAVKTGVFHNTSDPSVVSAFSTFDNAQSQFTEPLPGQAGQRNNLRPGRGTTVSTPVYRSDGECRGPRDKACSSGGRFSQRDQLCAIRSAQHQRVPGLLRFEFRPIHAPRDQPAGDAVCPAI